MVAIGRNRPAVDPFCSTQSTKLLDLHVLFPMAASILDFVLSLEAAVCEKNFLDEEKEQDQERDQKHQEVQVDEKEEDVEKKTMKKRSQWETKVKKMKVERLVWAHAPSIKNTKFLKGFSAMFPARTADSAEGACAPLPDGFWPIPANHVLVEYFCMLKESPPVPRMWVIATNKLEPFNAVLRGSKPAAFDSEDEEEDDEEESDDDNPNRWDAGHAQKLLVQLRGRFGRAEGKRIFDKIMSKAVEFLKGASDYHIPAPAIQPSRASNDGDDDDEDDDYGDDDWVPQRDDNDVDILQFAHKGRGQRNPQNETITAGRWISYQHKIFRNRTIYTRVVEVTDELHELLRLENDDILTPNDSIKLLNELTDAGSSSTAEGMGGTKEAEGGERVRVEGKGGYMKDGGCAGAIKDFQREISKIEAKVSGGDSGRWVSGVGCGR